MRITEEQFHQILFGDSAKDAPYAADATHQSHLFDQYKLYVEMMDRVSARRIIANSYFLSVNTALLGGVAYVARDSLNFLWVLGVAGIVLCGVWFAIIRSYRDLNTLKFRVIHAIEKRLPLSPYAAEWVAAGRGKDPKHYFPLTHLEIGVPFIFMALHLFVVIRTFPWAAIVSRL
jgi:hypothetical protein